MIARPKKSQIERKLAKMGAWQRWTRLTLVRPRWYFSPYPKEYYPGGYVDSLFVCEHTFAFYKSKRELSRAQARLARRAPPGNEIYRSGCVAMFEVDGAECTEYCQNLCYFAKLFLDHKTLYYDVDPFLFYVLCERAAGARERDAWAAAEGATGPARARALAARATRRGNADGRPDAAPGSTAAATTRSATTARRSTRKSATTSPASWPSRPTSARATAASSSPFRTRSAARSTRSARPRSRSVRDPARSLLRLGDSDLAPAASTRFPPPGDLGHIAYRSYWAATLLATVKRLPKDATNVSIMELSKATSIMADDVVATGAARAG